MKKIIATVLVSVMALVMFSVAVSAENTLVIDFNTPEGQAAGTFFGKGCKYAEDAGTGGKVIAYLENFAPDGSDASAESEGGLYGNGIAVKFNSDADGEATIVLKLICPDHVNGAYNYRLYHSINGSDFVKEALDEVQNHEFFDYTIKVNVKKGENTIKFVQGVSPWGNGEGGNGWRVDISTLTFTLPEGTPEQTGNSSYEGNCTDEFSAGADSVYLRGWGRIKDGTIESFGYRIDNGKPIFDASYQVDRDDVWAAFGIDKTTGNGFEMTVDTSKVAKGDHTITVVIKATDGNVIDIDTKEFQGHYEGTSNPATADAAVIAIAAVACIALAGIVIAKKVK